MGGIFKGAINKIIPIYQNFEWIIDNTFGHPVPTSRTRRVLCGSIKLNTKGAFKLLVLNLQQSGMSSFKVRDIQFKIMKLLEEEGYDLKRTQQQLTKRRVNEQK